VRDKWTAVRSAASRLTTGDGSVERLADLSIAAAAARKFGMLKESIRTFDGFALLDVVHEIALHPLPTLAESRDDWNRLAEDAVNAGDAIDSTRAIDDWIACSQRAMPGRKVRGAYATPVPFARLLARAALGPLRRSSKPVRVMDPSAGAGALLMAALQLLATGADERGLEASVYSLYGVEVDQSARELCCLLLWVAAARAKPKLERIAANVVVDNAITRDWWGSEWEFDALVMNPPWESLRQSVSNSDPQATVRAATLERLQQARRGTQGLPPLFTAQGKGDRNLFKLFLELAPHLLRPSGRLAILIPAAFASDLGMSALRQLYLDQFALERWTTFENLRGFFPIDSRYKFGILVGQRSPSGTRAIAIRGFASEPQHVKDVHVVASRQALERLGGPTRMLPELRSASELGTLSSALEAGSAFFAPGSVGTVRYRREIDLTLGRAKGLFAPIDDYQHLSVMADGSFVTLEGLQLVPVVEGRMVGRYDFFQKSWVSGRGRSARWVMNNGRPIESCRPQFVAPPEKHDFVRVALCDVTSATNTRTVHATWVPSTWRCGNTAPVLMFESEVLALAGMAVLNSMVFDWLARRLVSGLHLNRFYLETFVWPRLSEEAIQRLAGAAFGLCTLDPRFEAVFGTPQVPLREAIPLDFESAHVLIEGEVARGYGLTAGMLEDMFAVDRTDRRGFWRHFDREPRALNIVRRVVEFAHGQREVELV
jgi:N-6 DNA Methylase